MATKLLLIVFVLLVAKYVAGKAPPEKCSMAMYKKIGCFKDRIIPNRPLPLELVNHRDPMNPNWDSHILDWNEWPESLRALACACAEKAKSFGFKFFGLQFFGECWSGSALNYHRDGPSTNCIGNDFKPCNDSSPTECVGKAYTNYIYTLETVQKSPINGGWSDWSEWTECSASCNGGVRARERLCNNPAPENGGQGCKGEGEEEEVCNSEACEPVCAKQMEVAILLDASTSVTSTNWKKTVAFVQSFTKEFVMGPTGVRFAVIDFANEAQIQINILDPKYWSQEAFSRKVGSIEYSRGRTKTDLAIKLAREKIFCDKCNLRRTVPKLLIVLTDGQSTDPDLTEKEADLIKSQNKVSIITIGVGEKVDKNELTSMASNSDYVFLLNGYKYINDKINQIIKMSCKGKKN